MPEDYADSIILDIFFTISTIIEMPVKNMNLVSNIKTLQLEFTVESLIYYFPTSLCAMN